MSSASIPAFTSFDLKGVLKRTSIDGITLGLKLGLLLVALVCLGFVVNASLQHIFEGASAVDELRNKASEARQPVAPDQKPGARKNYHALAKSEMFGALGRVDAPKTEAKPTSQLALSLVGTFIADGEPFAIIEDQKKKNQEVFVLEEMVFGEAKLVKIASDRVEISRDGQIEILSIDDTPDADSSPVEGGVSAVGETEFLIEEAELNKALDNLPMLLTQARAVPYFRDGKSIGLRMFAIKSGSLFQKIGLLNGDILKAINGNSLSDITQAMKIFERLKEERSISVSLERNKEEKEFRYQVK